MMNRKASVFRLWQKLFSMCIKQKNKSGMAFSFSMAGVRVKRSLSEAFLPNSYYQDDTIVLR